MSPLTTFAFYFGFILSIPTIILNLIVLYLTFKCRLVNKVTRNIFYFLLFFTICNNILSIYDYQFDNRTLFGVILWLMVLIVVLGQTYRNFRVLKAFQVVDQSRITDFRLRLSQGIVYTFMALFTIPTIVSLVFQIQGVYVKGYTTLASLFGYTACAIFIFIDTFTSFYISSLISKMKTHVISRNSFDQLGSIKIRGYYLIFLDVFGLLIEIIQLLWYHQLPVEVDYLIQQTVNSCAGLHNALSIYIYLGIIKILFDKPRKVELKQQINQAFPTSTLAPTSPSIKDTIKL